MSVFTINCPVCGFEPPADCRWKCDACNTVWNTFDTRGQCPTCGKVFINTQCPTSKGGCGQWSKNADWYVTYEESEEDTLAPRSIWPWKNKTWIPITETDRKWVESSLLSFKEAFAYKLFNIWQTFTIDDILGNHVFSGSENDADLVLKRIAALSEIDIWEISLMFFKDNPVDSVGDVTTSPSPKINEQWLSKSTALIDEGLGKKEIWLDIELLKDPEDLVAAISYELSHYLLDYKIEMVADKRMICLIAIALGAGVYIGNSYFRHSTNGTRTTWQMRRMGYLPEQITAYALSWLASNRKEDDIWKNHLNKTMRKYVEQCDNYIKNTQ